MHWLNAGYCVWFNRRHRRNGHLLQGRFGAVLVEDDAGWQQVARYVHLNPVRVAHLKLDKSARAASHGGLVRRPEPDLVDERLRTLREYRWSSYRGYAGYTAPLGWVWSEPLPETGSVKEVGCQLRAHAMPRSPVSPNKFARKPSPCLPVPQCAVQNSFQRSQMRTLPPMNAPNAKLAYHNPASPMTTKAFPTQASTKSMPNSTSCNSAAATQVTTSPAMPIGLRTASATVASRLLAALAPSTAPLVESKNRKSKIKNSCTTKYHRTSPNITKYHKNIMGGKSQILNRKS